MGVGLQNQRSQFDSDTRLFSAFAGVRWISAAVVGVLSPSTEAERVGVLANVTVVGPKTQKLISYLLCRHKLITEGTLG
jgi:hypothetical protein